MKQEEGIMNYFQQPIFYALLMCVAGFGIPIMAALNGSLGAKLHSPAVCAARDPLLFAAVPLWNENHSTLNGSYRTTVLAHGAMQTQA